MSLTRTRLFALLAALVVAVAAMGALTPSGAVPRWASVSTATIRPGIQMVTQGAQCTANFVYYDAAGNVYLGMAAHCAGKGSSSDINGCTTPSYPLGTTVEFRRGGNLFTSGTLVGRGTLAYSSWLNMQRLHTTNTARCTYNDLALVKVNVADRGKVNPTVPVWGGPRTIGGAPLAPGAKLYTVGNSSLRFGTGFGQGKTGSVIDRVAGLAYEIKTGSPGIPGDSGSGFMDATGRAMGVLSTIEVGLSLNPVTNTMGDLYAELTWARNYSGIRGLMLAAGTQPFHTS